MRIFVRKEEVKDYRRVEEITRIAFSYPGRVEQGQRWKVYWQVM